MFRMKLRLILLKAKINHQLVEGLEGQLLQLFFDCLNLLELQYAGVEILMESWGYKLQEK